ncbi:hypothetical protein F0562_017186 [Nyssa sinensis]|uniref:DUF4220 domain-containing protein n=1 Tax=Nyssa sinensis TaxID=561372 RepID=A0A5J4ZH53_9ASTE|nr:hypothetical protein F0562_017186 [Nyssa sinensis]
MEYPYCCSRQSLLPAFAVGLISNGQGNDCDKLKINEDLAAFWAPFLLLHLGGPDTITAFSLEDNELWLRHLLGLVIELVAVAYVFSQSMPNHDFWIPTVLVFFAGAIKYAERTRALYLACLGNFKESMLPKPDAGPNYAQLMEEYTAKEAAHVPVRIEIEPEPEKKLPPLEDLEKLEKEAKSLEDVEVVERGYNFFETFKGLIVDLMFSFHERNESRNFFFKMKSKDAFKVMEVELNFMYDVLYTKMAVVHRKIGYFFRFICSALIAVSFQHFASHHKHNIHHFDIAVTYTLLGGAVALDFVALFKLIFSDWTIIRLKNSEAKKIVSAVRDTLSIEKRCRWSKSISQHSLISYCLKKRFKWFDKAADFFGLKDFLDEVQYKETNPVEDDLKKFIFSELRKKAEIARDSKIAKEIYSMRGDGVLSQSICHYTSIVSSVSEEVEYDESLLRWHIATELCYFPETDTNDPNHENRKFCKYLSEYMLYLLVMRPTMMSAVAGIGQIRFRDTCEEAKKFFRKGKPISKTVILLSVLNAPMKKMKKCFGKSQSKSKEERQNAPMRKMKKCFGKSQSKSKEERRDACEKLMAVNTVVKPIAVKGDRSKSVLFDACMLAKDLKKLDDKKRWDIMSKVWVELLSYAASHCRANTHAQQLSKGGELVTFVWLLMAHFGLGEQFRIEAGHARAKLIVEK